MVRRVTAGPETAGERLDRWLPRHVPGVDAERARGLLSEGRVRIRGRVCRPGRILGGGEEIEVDFPSPRALPGHAATLPLPVLHEDAHMVVVDKPPGLNVEPEGRFPSVVASLAARGGFEVAGVAAPGVVHRLDRWTSGCLVLVRTDDAMAAMKAAFQERRVDKRYLALVLGEPPDEARLEGPYARDPADRRRYTTRVASARRAALSFRIRERFRGVAAPITLAEVRLETGRTHQIRVQLSEAGFPVLADPLYGPAAAREHPAARRIGRLALHAWRLAYPHPSHGGAMRFEAPLPADFEAALRMLRDA